MVRRSSTRSGSIRPQTADAILAVFLLQNVILPLLDKVTGPDHRRVLLPASMSTTAPASLSLAWPVIEHMFRIMCVTTQGLVVESVWSLWARH